MKQLTVTRAGVLEWLDVPEPKLEGSRDALVHPVAVATCDIDGPMLRGDAPFPPPIALGHEFVARVVEVSADVETVRPGDLVVVAFQISCGRCARCDRGLTGSCLSVPPRSQFGFGAIGGAWGGALSDLVRVPFADAMLVPVPDGLSPVDIASVSDNVPDGYRAAGVYLEEDPDQSVLIIGGGGGGSIGLYAAGIACAMGAPLVHYMDVDPERNAVAESLGATVLDWPPPERLGPYPITVNATGDVAALACALRSTEPGGTCTSTGIYFTPPTLPLLDMFVTGMTFKTGRAHARAFIPRVLDLIRAGRFHPEVVTSAVIPWEDAAAKLPDIQSKVVIARAD